MQVNLMTMYFFLIADWPESCQRFLLEAFDENFANSPGRNGLHALLTSLLTSSALTIYNIGGGSRKNKKLGRLGIQYNYYNSENVRLEKIDLEESTSESSPEKSLSSPEKSSPEKSSPEKSTDSSTSSTTTEYDATHTPVVDCLVTGPDTSILVGSLKSGSLRPEHLEQLRLELLSQISMQSGWCFNMRTGSQSLYSCQGSGRNKHNTHEQLQIYQRQPHGGVFPILDRSNYIFECM